MVERQTRDTAEAVGLFDRGLVAPGYRADLNVIDYDRLSLSAPEVVYDLPAGGRRLDQRARGYVATIVAGQVTYRDGEPTGALPGRLVRGARPAGSRARRSFMTPEVLETKCEWAAEDVRDPEAWTERFSEAELRELDAAVAYARSRSERHAGDRQGRVPAARRSARA